jgi:alanine-synthesizing transaminase
MLEVCSTTMPQYVLPSIYESPEFKPYLRERIEIYKKKALKIEEYFKDFDSIIYVKPK